MEEVIISLEDFQAISKGENPVTTQEVIDNIKSGAEYVIFSDDMEYKVMLYKDADGREILGLNNL